MRVCLLANVLNSICEISAKSNGIIPIFAEVKSILLKTVNEHFHIYHKQLMKLCKQIESTHNKQQRKLLSRMYTVMYKLLLGNGSITPSHGNFSVNSPLLGKHVPTNM
jgi:hypothetical protein